MGSTERRLGVYLLRFSQAVTLLFHGLIHGSFTILPPNRFPPPLSTVAERFRSQVRNSFVQTPTISWTLRLAVLSPSFHVGIEQLKTNVRV